MKIGIIGIGSMGSIIGHALLEKKMDLILSDRGKNLEEFRDKNVEITSNIDLVKKSDYIILAVKPNIYKKVIDEIKDFLEDKVLISIAAGMSLKKLEDMLGDKKIVMTMPNTPAKVKAGVSAICPNKNIEKKELEEVLQIFSSFGLAKVIEEKEFDAFSAAIGTLPAYVFMFIEAVADGAVLNGLKREDAYKFVAQTLMGSAKMMLETNLHPGVLKDMVTSPNGTTIEGVKVLEEKAFRGALIEAINKAYQKSKNM